jgi:hypothetical protein
MAHVFAEAKKTIEGDRHLRTSTPQPYGHPPSYSLHFVQDKVLRASWNESLCFWQSQLNSALSTRYSKAIFRQTSQRSASVLDLDFWRMVDCASVLADVLCLSSRIQEYIEEKGCRSIPCTKYGWTHAILHPSPRKSCIAEL